MAKELTIAIRAKNLTQRAIRGVVSGFKKLGSTIKSFSSASFAAVKRVVKGLAAIGGAVGVVGGFLVKLSSDAEEMRGKFNVVFGSAAKDVEEWAKTTGDALNRGKTELMGYASTFQDTFVPMGFAREEAAKLSKSLTSLAVDMASFNNVADADVVRDLQSALVGNSETVRKYGIILTEAGIAQEAVNLGLAATTKQVSNAAKVQARYSLILKGSVDAQGDAARTSDSTANAYRGLVSTLKELGIETGQAISEGLELGKIFKQWSERIREFQDSEAFGRITTKIKTMLADAKAFVDILIEGGKARGEAIQSLGNVIKLSLEIGAMKAANIVGNAIGDAWDRAKDTIYAGLKEAVLLAVVPFRALIKGAQAAGKASVTVPRVAKDIFDVKGKEKELERTQTKLSKLVETQRKKTADVVAQKEVGLAGEQALVELNLEQDNLRKKSEEELAAADDLAKKKSELDTALVEDKKLQEIEAVKEVAAVKKKLEARPAALDLGQFAGQAITVETVQRSTHADRTIARRAEEERIASVVMAFKQAMGNSDKVLKNIEESSATTANNINAAIGMG